MDINTRLIASNAKLRQRLDQILDDAAFDLEQGQANHQKTGQQIATLLQIIKKQQRKEHELCDV